MTAHNNISDTVEKLFEENKKLRLQVSEYEQKIAAFTPEKDIVSPKDVITTKELEQYKNHLEDVIRERTEELKTSELRFLTLSDSIIGGAIFEVTITSNSKLWVGYASKTIQTLIDYDIKGLQNNPLAFLERIHPDDMDRLEKAFVNSKDTLSEFNIELRYYTEKKDIKWLHIKANIIEDHGDFTVWVGIVLDTTEKNHYHQKIREREAILNAIIENVPFEFWARDAQLTCFLQNNASQKMWGNILHTLPHQHPMSDKARGVYDQLLKRVMLGDIVNEETSVTDIQGVNYDFQTLMAPIMLNNELQGILGLNIDITDRKQVEKALIQNEEKFRNIFDSSTDAIIMHTYNGAIIEMNKEFKNLIQLQEKTIHNLSDFLSLQDTTQFLNLVVANCKHNQNVLFETEIELSNATKIPIEIKTKEIEHLGSKVVLSLIQNTTYRKKFERKLLTTIVETEEGERARLASDLHDDVGPILSSMKMLTGLLLDAQDFDAVKNISNQLFELVSESIRSVRETSNSISPHVLKNYGIIAATKNIIQTFQHKINIAIDSNCESKRFESTTETIYYRIIRELLHNTMKHAEAKKVNIQLNLQNNFLILEYKDDGRGFNVEEKLQESHGGLGLYNIVSRIKSLEASYSLKSEPGKGMYFILKTKILN